MITRILLIILCTIIACTASLAQYDKGQILYEANGIDHNSITDLATADIDNDGDIDFVLSSYEDNKVSWYANDGLGNFSAQQIISYNTERATDIEIGDINGSGELDVITMGSTGSTIAWHENSSATFGNENIIQSNNSSGGDFLLADFNNDGSIDLVTYLGFSDETLIYFNDGMGNFSPAQLISALENPIDLKAIDLDGDNDLDLAATFTDINTIFWFENYGAGVFSEEQILIELTNSFSDIAFGDIDNDGDQDIYSTNQTNIFGAPTLLFHENIGNLNYTTIEVLPVYDDINGLQVIDFDQDNDNDLILFVEVGFIFGNLKMLFYENNGDGTYTIKEYIYSQVAFSGLTVDDFEISDFNGDGKLDVLMSSQNDLVTLHDYNDIQNNIINYDTILNSEIQSSLQRQLTFTDVDENNAIDVVLSLIDSSNSNDQVLPLVQDLNNDFTENPNLNTTALNGFSKKNFVGDLNGDGLEDVLYQQSENSFEWFAKLPGGGYTATGQSYDLDTINLEVFQLADIDQDGDIDILVSLELQNTTAQEFVVVIENDGLGNFTSYNTIESNPKDIIKLGTGDINGDGQLDIVATGKSYFGWYRQVIAGQGNFTSFNSVNLPTRDGDIPDLYNFYFGDVDGDGDEEIFAKYGIYFYFCAFGMCSTTTDARTIIYDVQNQNNNLNIVRTIGNWLHDYANHGFIPDTKDVNGDGKDDLLVFEDGGEGIIWRLGDGNGFFNQTTTVAKKVNIDNYPELRAEDYDNDGDLDVFFLQVEDDFSRLELFVNKVDEDEDEDGVLFQNDCDDNNPAVGSSIPDPIVDVVYEICLGQNLSVLPNNSLPGTSHYWEGPNDLTTNAYNLSFNPAEESDGGLYSIVTSNSSCESAEITFEIVVLDTPELTLVLNDLTLAATTNSGVVFLWYKDGVLLEETAVPTFEVLESGNYSVVAIDANGCSSVAHLEVVITGVFNQQTQSIQIYPNPVLGETIRLEGEFSESANYEIYNLQGKLIQQDRLQVKSQIELESAANGIYILKVIDQEKVYIGKFELMK